MDFLWQPIYETVIYHMIYFMFLLLRCVDKRIYVFRFGLIDNLIVDKREKL